MFRPSLALTGRLAFATVLILAAGVPAALATTNEEAEELCTAELTTVENATEIRDLSVRRDDGKPIVYGRADFDGVGNVRFKCRVYRNRVTGVSYRVRRASRLGGWEWADERPRGREVPERPAATVVVEPDVAPANPSFLSVGERGALGAQPEADTSETVPTETEAEAATPTETEAQAAVPQAEDLTRPKTVRVGGTDAEDAEAETEAGGSEQSGEQPAKRFFRKVP